MKLYHTIVVSDGRAVAVLTGTTPEQRDENLLDFFARDEPDEDPEVDAALRRAIAWRDVAKARREYVALYEVRLDNIEEDMPI